MQKMEPYTQPKTICESEKDVSKGREQGQRNEASAATATTVSNNGIDRMDTASRCSEDGDPHSAGSMFVINIEKRQAV